MKKTIVLALILTVVSLGLTGCKDRRKHPSKETVSKETSIAMLNVTKEEALTIAQNLLISKEIIKDFRLYEINIEEKESVWIVSFEKEMPHAPGDEFAVYVQKHDGSSEIFYGE